MNAIDTIKTVVTSKAGRTVLLGRKYSPEILIGVGIIGVVTAGVLAARATLKLETVVDGAKDELEDIHTLRDNSSIVDYSDNKHGRNVAKVYVKTGFSLVKLYGPSISLAAVSVACLIGSHGIMRRRNAALVVMYKGVETMYNNYRARVVEEYGPEKDLDYHLGRREVIQETKDPETGKVVKNSVSVVDPNKVSQFAKFFDETNPNYQKNAEYNLLFLKCQQTYANDLLHSRGHIFLNDVYDSLGIPRTKAGCNVGWAVTKDGNNFVDFGIYDILNGQKRDFVNGYERSILLDFNVDGVIWDLI